MELWVCIPDMQTRFCVYSLQATRIGLFLSWARLTQEDSLLNLLQSTVCMANQSFGGQNTESCVFAQQVTG